MGTGSYFNQIFLKNVHRSNLETIKEDTESMMKFLGDKIKALVCATPRDMKDEGGYYINWEQHYSREVQEDLEEYVEYAIKNFLVTHALEFPEDLEDELEE